MCGVGKLPKNTKGIIIKTSKGHKLFVDNNPNEIRQNLEKLLTLQQDIENFEILPINFIGDGKYFRQQILWRNAKANLLGINYNNWPLRKKLLAHLRIYVCKIQKPFVVHLPKLKTAHLPF